MKDTQKLLKKKLLRLLDSFAQLPGNGDGRIWIDSQEEVALLPNREMLIRVLSPNGSTKVKIVDWRDFVDNYLHLFNDEDLNYHINQLQLFLPFATITAADILACQNQEFRRRLIRSMGFDRFVQESQPTCIDRDGSSALLRIKYAGTRGAGSTSRSKKQKLEDIVVVKVVCPSTHDTYLLRVPPTMKSCKQAIAWTFGLEASQYQPLVQT